MSAQTLHFVPSADFRSRTAEAVSDPQLRRSFRGAMDFLQGKRSAQFPDADELEALRTLGEAVRQHALQNLPQLLEQLEQNLTRNGVQVHWARDAAEANQLVLQIAQRAAAKK
jgi:L-lactate dehydrogenase complex protein LldF